MKYYPLLKWNKTTVSIIFSCMLASGINAQNTQITTREAKRQYSTINMSRTSVHDPSVVYDTNSKQYYIFGSHNAVSSTKDLKKLSWVNVNCEINDIINMKTVNFTLSFLTKTTKGLNIKDEKVKLVIFDASA